MALSIPATALPATALIVNPGWHYLLDVCIRKVSAGILNLVL
ncbi:MAG: hypothetical protein AAGF75_07780 [Cyanobacteria bacterium P01_H01_bin.130]